MNTEALNKAIEFFEKKDYLFEASTPEKIKTMIARLTFLSLKIKDSTSEAEPKLSAQGRRVSISIQDYKQPNIEELCADAKDDYYKYKAALNCAADLIEKGTQVPDSLAKLVVEHLRGTQPPKKKKITKTAMRNLDLALAVYIINKDFNIDPTRNDGSAKDSCCDIVAEAYNNVAKKKRFSCVDFETVKKAWAATADMR